MAQSIKEAILKKRDPLGYELEKLRADMLSMKEGGLKEVAEIVFERKLSEMKEEILAQIEAYVGDVTEELIARNLKGDQGEKGEQGIRGAKGDQGDRGAPGPRGEQGPQGERGWIGPDGKDGIDGKDGRDGRDGKDGRDGIDGTSVAVEDVIASLRPEFDKFIVDARNTLRTMKTDKGGGGGGGGGMSSPTTFSFTGNGADTTFVLSAKVAANGMAIWAYVNGQWIQPGVHFNVTNINRTLTTTFTPANGDVIEGFFLRA